MTAVTGAIRVNTIADLRIQPVTNNTLVICAGVASKFDGMGSFFSWDDSSVAADDTTNYNVVKSNLTNVGRWIRIFQRVRQLPHGVLLTVGPFKTFFAAGVTDAAGKVALNLTMDGTATGTAIFGSVLGMTSVSLDDAATPEDATHSFFIEWPKPANGWKRTVHGFYKANLVTAVLGLVIKPVALVGAGKNVQFVIQGM